MPLTIPSEDDHDDFSNEFIDNEPQLPVGMSSVGLIPNPIDKNEILLIGSSNNNDIYSYDITSKKFDQISNIDFLDTISSKVSSPNVLLFERNELEYNFTYNIENDDSISNNNLIIVFGSHNHNKSEFYSIFDPKTLSFKYFENILCNNDDFLFHNDGSRSIIFKNWLFISGGFLIDRRSKITIFKLNNDGTLVKNTNKKSVCTYSIKLSKIYNHHGFILLNWKKLNNNKYSIQLLIFGGMWEYFNQSFVIVDIELPIETDKNIDNNNWMNNINYNIKENNYTNNLFFDKNSNFTILFKQFYGMMNFNKSFVFSNFRYNLCENSKYLILIGGHFDKYGNESILDDDRTHISKMIIYFDFIEHKWSIIKNIKLPIGMTGHSTVLIDNNKIYIMGFEKIYTSNIGKIEKGKYNLKLSLNHVDWNIERQIWIAFYKNNKNNKCFIDLLPKDIVKKILFICRKSIFDNHESI